MRLTALFLPLIFLLTACAKNTPDNNVKVDQLVFGTFYGMCIQNCIHMYQVDRATLQKDDSAKYPDESWAYNFNATATLPADKFNIARDLLDEVPAELFTNNNKTYGAPDSHDQGGIYILVQKGSQKRRFRIDFDNSPDQSPELVKFKNKVAGIVSKLQ